MLTFAGKALEAVTTLRDGTHRTATLEQTWARFAPAAKRAGITRIAELTGLDTLGIPVFAAVRPLGRSLSTQQGKGITPLAAKVSALMESLETWTAEQAIPTRRGSYRQLRGPRLRGAAINARARPIDVRALPRPRGRLDLDASLNARVSALSLDGDSMVLKLVGGFAKPHLDRLEGRTISLASFTPAGMKVREIELSAGPQLKLRAVFGAD